MITKQVNSDIKATMKLHIYAELSKIAELSHNNHQINHNRCPAITISKTQSHQCKNKEFPFYLAVQNNCNQLGITVHSTSIRGVRMEIHTTVASDCVNRVC